MAQTAEPTISVSAAKKLDRKVLASFDTVETFSMELCENLAEMRNTLGYKHLGFDSYAEYLHERTASYTHLKATRAGLVWALDDSGMSQRDIAERLGVSQSSVRNDVAKRKKLDDLSIKYSDKLTNPEPKPEPDPEPDPDARAQYQGPHCGTESDGFPTAFGIVNAYLKNMLQNPTWSELERMKRMLQRHLVRVEKLQGVINNDAVSA